LCVDELNSDAYAVRAAANTALEKVVRVQRSTDLLRSQIAAFVFCNRTASYHSESIRIQLSDLAIISSVRPSLKNSWSGS